MDRLVPNNRSTDQSGLHRLLSTVALVYVCVLFVSLLVACLMCVCGCMCVLVGVCVCVSVCVFMVVGFFNCHAG